MAKVKGYLSDIANRRVRQTEQEKSFENIVRTEFNKYAKEYENGSKLTLKLKTYRTKKDSSSDSLLTILKWEYYLEVLKKKGLFSKEELIARIRTPIYKEIGIIKPVIFPFPTKLDKVKYNFNINIEVHYPDFLPYAYRIDKSYKSENLGKATVSKCFKS